jgi:GDPmannose 4,6-dehydratase
LKKALVTGVGGQDGYYLSRLLVSHGYDVIGCGRLRSLEGSRGSEIRSIGVRLVEVDLLDRASTHQMIAELRPDEIYNLAGHSFVPASWTDAAAAVQITSWPVIHLLEAIRANGGSTRLYQSSTSEIFGCANDTPQSEETPASPANPYAAAKVFAHNIVDLYRNHYGIFAVSGILYNHESPRRPPEFLTRKVSLAAARIRAGLQSEIALGDLDAVRDWGFAGDYVDAMWRMLQMEVPQNFVIGTGIAHTVRDVCATAFAAVGLDYSAYVRVSDELRRNDHVTRLIAKPDNARKTLGWIAQTSFENLIEMMVESDVRLVRNQ